MDTVMTRFGRGTLRATSHSRHPILSNAGDSCCRMFISEPCILNLCEVTSPKFSGIPLLEFSASYDARGLVGLSAGVDPAGLCAICREGREVRELALRTPVNNIEYFPPNFDGLVLGSIDADFCK